MTESNLIPVPIAELEGAALDWAVGQVVDDIVTLKEWPSRKLFVTLHKPFWWKDEDGEVLNPESVWLWCGNCSTLHDINENAKRRASKGDSTHE